MAGLLSNIWGFLSYVLNTISGIILFKILFFGSLALVLAFYTVYIKSTRKV